MPCPTEDHQEEIRIDGWHLKKEIQIGHIVTSIIILVSMLGYVWSIEKRITIIETQVVALHDADGEQRRQTTEAMQLIRQDLQTLSNKIDRLIERLVK